jgi:OmpA-OmpF porin, OOP family
MLRMMGFGFLMSLVVSPVFADAERGATFGLGVSRNKYELNPASAFGLNGSDSATGWDVFAGYRLNRFLGFEANYFDGGSVNTAIGNSTVRLDGKGFGASVLGSFPIGEAFAVYGRAGYMKGELELVASGPGGTAAADDDDEAPIFGAGIRTMLDGAQIRLEYDRVEFDAIDVARVSLSVAWLF